MVPGPLPQTRRTGPLSRLGALSGRLASLAGRRIGTLTRRLGPGPALLAWAIEGRHDWAVLVLEGRLDWSSGPVLGAAWIAVDSLHPGRIAIDLSGVRRWDAKGLARLVEMGASEGDVTVFGAGPKLRRSLAATGLGWELVPGGQPDQPATSQPSARAVSAGEMPICLHASPPRCGFEPAQLLDIALAGFALFALAPLLGCLALAIRLDSPGPAVYTQLRAGKARADGSVRVFRLYKFRTMVDGADALRIALRSATPGGPFFKIKGDPRITRVGRYLRAWSLDELPQLLNVVRGEMRLVGNRPLPLDEAELLREPWQRARFFAPAGLTGLWQVSVRSDCTPRARLALDTAYAATRSPWLDFRILLATVLAVIRRKGW